MVHTSGVLGVLALLTTLARSQIQQTDRTNLEHTLTLSYQPVAPTNAPINQLAVVTYDISPLKSSLLSWTPPEPSEDTASDISTPLLRVLSPSGSSSLISQAALSPQISQNIDIWVTPSNEIFSVSLTSIQPPPLSREAAEQLAKEARLQARGKTISSSKPQTTKKPKKSKAEAKPSAVRVEEEEEGGGPRVRVKLHVVRDGPSPKLLSRAPVQVDGEGREVVPEGVEEKSFLQKYWLMLLIGAFFLLSSAGKE